MEAEVGINAKNTRIFMTGSGGGAIAAATSAFCGRAPGTARFGL